MFCATIRSHVSFSGHASVSDVLWSGSVGIGLSPIIAPKSSADMSLKGVLPATQELPGSALCRSMKPAERRPRPRLATAAAGGSRWEEVGDGERR